MPTFVSNTAVVMTATPVIPLPEDVEDLVFPVTKLLHLEDLPFSNDANYD